MRNFSYSGGAESEMSCRPSVTLKGISANEKSSALPRNPVRVGRPLCWGKVMDRLRGVERRGRSITEGAGQVAAAVGYGAFDPGLFAAAQEHDQILVLEFNFREGGRLVCFF